MAQPAPKEEATAAPSNAAPPAATEPVAPSKGQQIKEKLWGLFAKARAKLPAAPQLPKFSVKEKLAQGFAPLKDILSIPLLIITGDWLTRFAILGFLVSLTLLVVVTPRLIGVLRSMMGLAPVAQVVSQKGPNGTKASQFFHEQMSQVKRMNSVVYIGRFSNNLQSEDGKVVVFEMEFFVECSTEAAAQQLKNRMPLVQDKVTAVLQGQTYEGLMSPAGKDALRRKLARTLDTVIDHGEVKNVLISKFIAE